MALQQPRKIRRTMFIGLGGTGNEVIRRVKQEMLGHKYDLPLFQYLVLDTVAFDEKPGMPPLMRLRNGEEYLYIGGYNPNDVLKNIGNWPVIARWWGNRTRTNLVAVDEGAGQMRSVGRMGFFYHFNTIQVQLRRMIQEITSTSNRENAMLSNYDVSANDPIIYIVFSLCGGTGSSLFFDVAYAIRHLLNAGGLKPTIVGITMLPGPYIQAISSIPQQERIQANSYAALMEMERLHNMALGLEPRPNGKDIWSVQYATNFRVDSAELPFEYIYLIDDTTVNGEKHKRDRIYNALGKAIFWLSGPSTATHFWERAKNLNSKTVASGGIPDATGRKRLSPYSSLGVSTVKLDWQFERLQHELENKFIECIRKMEATRPGLPNYLNSTNSLVEEVSGEATGVNPFPPTKALQASNTLKDLAAVDEMLTRHTEKYQAALNSIARSSLWQYKKKECKETCIVEIDKHIQSSLCIRGPVAAVRELEMIRERLMTLITGLDEMSQKAKLRKAELDDEYTRNSSVAQPNSLLEQTFANFVNFAKRLYLFKQFRRASTSRELTTLARQQARKRYEWYQASFNIVIYSDIVKTILEPLIAHVDRQKATCEGVDRELEALYDANKEAHRINSLLTAQHHIDRIRPHLSEKDQVSEAIKSGRLKVDQKLEAILKGAFSTWPKPGGDAMAELKPVLSSVVMDTLKIIEGEEHLAKRLCGADTTIVRQRKAFLEGAECMWNFAKDVSQNILSHLEPIELVGYGIEGHQGITTPDLTPVLDDLLKNQSARPDTISTDIGDELVLLKTSHGLPISAIRTINELQHAYQVMNTVRGAPYLHIDYADQVRAGYGPLANVAWTYRELMKIWYDEADNLDYSNPKLANEARTVLTKYESVLQSKGIYTGGTIDVMDEKDSFFDLVDELRWAIRPLNQTPAVAQALMKFADLEDILHAQGWIKIEPTYGERFNPSLHSALNRRAEPNMPPGRVIEVHRPGYIRHQSNNNNITRTQIRLALVDVSS